MRYADCFGNGQSLMLTVTSSLEALADDGFNIVSRESPDGNVPSRYKVSKKVEGNTYSYFFNENELIAFTLGLYLGYDQAERSAQ